MHYRADIDGLRALAVLPVLAFHAGLAPFSGGFVGVDVFFVISGYLIAGLILPRIRAGRFSLLEFYERRARRLLPALFVVMAVSGALAAALFLPAELREFGQSAVAATLFASNVLFSRETGYFETEAALKPLLHTWSLGVEEQFYLLFPLLLMALAARRAGRVALVPVLAALALASLALAAWAVPRAPAFAFYLLPTRLWELMLGALLAVAPLPALRRRAVREAAAAAGLAAILWAMLRYSEATPFPGPAALLPCLGAALVIHAGASGPTAVSRALSLGPVVFVGLISYALYLWHWPVLVFAEYAAVRELTTVETGAALALSGVLAALTWRFVERPFRRPAGPIGRPARGAGAAGPGVAGPGVAGPGVAAPGVAGPGVAGPGVVRDALAEDAVVRD